MAGESNPTVPTPPEEKLNINAANADDAGSSSGSNSSFGSQYTSIASSTDDTTDSPPSESMKSTSIITGIDDGNIMNNNKNNTTSSLSPRHQMGRQLSNVSDLINDNLIVVRYATISTVLLLGVYGVANTPLFYRYRHVMDIPQKMFSKRKWIHGRIVGVVETERLGSSSMGSTQSTRKMSNNWSKSSTSNTPKQQHGVASLLSSTLKRATGTESRDSPNSGDDGDHNHETIHVQPEQRPIMVLFRHSSPMERLLTQSAMDRILSFTGKSPSRLLYSSANAHRNLLPIELSGVVAPPPSNPSSILSDALTGASSNQFPLIDQLVTRKAKVSLQLLAHRTTANGLSSTKKGHLDESKNEERNFLMDDEIHNAAICHVHYRQPKQWFPTTNASLEMVEKGQAWINSSGNVVPLSSVADDDTSSTSTNENKNNASILNFNPTVKQLQNDTKFISQLEEAEYSSWRLKVGMWSSNRTREFRREYIEEEESLKNKWSVWSLMKRGWDRIRR